MNQKNQDLARKVLKTHRLEIDKLDRKILTLLGERFGVVRRVAEVKIKHDIPGFLGDRVKEVKDNAAAHAKKYGIDPEFARMLYTLIIYESCATEDLIKASRAKEPAAKAKAGKKKK